MNRLLLLTLILGISTYSWAYDFKSGDLYYNITNNSAPYTVEVTYSSTSIPSSDDDVNYANLITANIPASVSYSGKTYSVTGIGSAAFSMCSSLTSISIPNIFAIPNRAASIPKRFVRFSWITDMRSLAMHILIPIWREC